jgi:hypothetical protein
VCVCVEGTEVYVYKVTAELSTEIMTSTTRVQFLNY